MQPLLGLDQSDSAKESLHGSLAQHMICLRSSFPRQFAIVRHFRLRPRMRRVSGLHASHCSQSSGLNLERRKIAHCPTRADEGLTLKSCKSSWQCATIKARRLAGSACFDAWNASSLSTSCRIRSRLCDDNHSV